VREAAIGVAAAGAGIGILRMMGMLDLPAHRNAPVLPEQTPSGPPDAISREELQRALSEAAQQNETLLKTALNEHVDQLRQLRTAYDGRIEQISARYDQLLADKDQTIAGLLRELRKTQHVAPHIVHRDAQAPEEDAPVAESPVAEPQAEEPVAEAPIEPAPAPSENASKAQAIVDLLSHEEYDELKQVIATASPQAVAFTERQFSSMTAEEAVAWLRANVLTSRTAA
jgi:hypothetical protein